MTATIRQSSAKSPPPLDAAGSIARQPFAQKSRSWEARDFGPWRNAGSQPDDECHPPHLPRWVVLDVDDRKKGVWQVMELMSRTLAPAPLRTLREYLDSGGLQGLATARAADPLDVITLVEESGLQARGGAGKLCGPKWRTVSSHGAGALVPPSVVVNAAEGEPGSFKDRAILLRNPYLVLEGAMIAAYAVGAADVVIAMKRMHHAVRSRTVDAIEEIRHDGWLDGVDVQIFGGPNEYLYGEETALLEAIDGRPPFPRLAPPYRHGVHEVPDHAPAAESHGASSAHIELAGPDRGAVGSPTLVNNVETIANIPGIISKGPEWFRSVGTAESPGSIVCTVTGATRRHGVGEVPMGTPLRNVIELIGGGPEPGHTVKAVIGGAATPLLTGDQLDAPVSNAGMKSIGARLGCGAFIVFDDRSDMAAVAEGVARFLAVESCGLCVPCKEDGLELADLFGRIRRSDATRVDLAAVRDRLRTVENGARCGLASQYMLVLGSVLELFGDEIDAHIDRSVPAAPENIVAAIVDIDHDRALLDLSQHDKQPDWTYHARDSGKFPADRLRSDRPVVTD
jgi:NADH-quinone oxidoreductase subunit F